MINKFKCEKCNKSHDGSYGSGRFCSKECARSFSTKKVDRLKTILSKCSSCGEEISVNFRSNLNTIKCDSCKEKAKLLRKVIDIKTGKQLECNICGTKYNKRGTGKQCKRPDVCKKHRLIPGFIKYFGFDKSTLGSELAYKEFDRIVSILYDDYYTNKMSTCEIAEKYNHNRACNIRKILVSLGFETRDLSEAGINALETGRAKLPFSNNTYKHGWHTTWEGKEIFYRSSYELDFCKLLDEQKIKYEVEFLKIGYFDTQLARQRLAIPDFYLPETNEIVEVKSSYTYDEQNMKDKFKAYQEHGYKYKLWLDKVYVNIK